MVSELYKMEPTATLKRKRKTSAHVEGRCLFCKQQKKRQEPLRASMDEGKRVHHVLAECQRLEDNKNPVILKMLSDMDEQGCTERLMWHKSFYGNFTTETRLIRLQKKKCAENAPEKPKNKIFCHELGLVHDLPRPTKRVKHAKYFNTFYVKKKFKRWQYFIPPCECVLQM